MGSYDGISKHKTDGVRAFIRNHLGKPIKVTMEGNEEVYGICQFQDDYGNITLNCSGNQIVITRIALRRLEPESKEKQSTLKVR